jgi:hypothetical protein
MRFACEPRRFSARSRHVEHQQEIRRLKRRVVTTEVCCAVAELHRREVYPTVPLVLETMPHPELWSRTLIGENVRRARHELAIELGKADPCQR